MLIGDDACEPFCVEPADDIRGLNAAIDCDTPSAKMNCSRSSMFVRPLANFSDFFQFYHQFQNVQLFSIFIRYANVRDVFNDCVYMCVCVWEVVCMLCVCVCGC